MSSYVNFYLRMNETFIPITDYSRNSTIYQFVAHGAPYGKIKPVTLDMIEDYISNAVDRINEIEESINKEKSTISIIMDAKGNSLEEKVDYLEEINNLIEDYEHEKEYVRKAICFFGVLEDMIENRRFCSERFEDFKNDFNHYIYVGEESDGSIESIEEGYE